MPTKFEYKIAELEDIAANDCQCDRKIRCEKENDGRCPACIAAGALNRMSADAYDTLEELEAEK